jgi:nitroreductase
MAPHAPSDVQWRVREADFSRIDAACDKLAFLLRYAILAPSSHNTQPWTFAVDRVDQVSVYADASRWLRVADADKRELFISVGCALENLVVAAEHFGYTTQVSYFPAPADESLVATVRMRCNGDPASPRSPHLFDAIVARHTNHETFTARPIPGPQLEWLRACCFEPDIRLFLTEDPDIRRRADELVVESDARQFADPAYREELAYWIGQGVFGTPWLMAQIAKLAVAYINLGSSVASKDSEVLMSAPMLALLASRENDRASQVRVGQAFERIYLTATALGIAIRPMSQVLELPEQKEKLAKLLRVADACPQQPFLLGYANPAEHHTPRRPLEDVLR